MVTGVMLGSLAVRLLLLLLLLLLLPPLLPPWPMQHALADTAFKFKTMRR